MSFNMDFDLRENSRCLWKEGSRLNRKITQLLQGNLRVYFVALMVFTAMMACYSVPWLRDSWW